MTAPNFRIFSGVLSGANNLTTTSTFTWDGGQMSGVGTTIVSSGTALLQTGPLTPNRNLTLSGNTTFNLTTGNALNAGTGVTITNNTMFDILDGDLLGSTASFANNGTLGKDGGLTTSSVTVPITGSGTASITIGTLQVNDASFGPVGTNASGVLELRGTTTLGNVNGNGKVVVSSGATTINGSVVLFPAPGWLEVDGGTLTLNDTVLAAVLASFTMKGGTLTGPSNLSVQMFTFDGGTIAGTGTAMATLSLNITGASGPMTLTRARSTPSHVPGSYTAPNATNILTVVAPGSITNGNNAPFTFVSDFDLAASGGATFTNNGIFTRPSSATSNVATAFTNSGTVTLSAGTTNFSNGYTQTAGTTTLGPGNLGGTTAINGGTIDGSGTITGNVTNGGNFSPGTSPGAVTITGD